MKFGRHLLTHSTPEWRTQFINYAMLKGMILRAAEKSTVAKERALLGDTLGCTPEELYEEFEIHFFEYCQKELRKINTFWTEKLAEAQRKFSALAVELKAHTSKTHLTANEERIRQKLPWFADFVEKDARREKIRYRKIHDLKLAFSEFYLGLILLQNFQGLNFTGFRKILKKHDKILHTDRGSVWRKEHVENAPFYLSRELEKLIHETENLVATELEGGDRGRAMRRLRVPPLNEPPSPTVYFLMGLFLGIFFVLLFVLILTGHFIGLPMDEWTVLVNQTNGSYILEQRSVKTDWRIVTRLYRGPFLLIAMLFLLSFNMQGWKAAGVNHVLIFELDPRNNLSQYHVLELAACLGVLWCTSLLFFFYSDFLGINHYAIPLIVAGLMVAGVLNPFHVFFYDARKWLICTIFRIITAPLYPVSFPDFWLADQFMSLTAAFLDIEYFICFYSFQVSWVTGGLPSSTNLCTTNSSAIRPIILVLPACFRFGQCLRRYRDSRLAFPHLLNASRYSLTFFVGLFSSLSSLHVEVYAEDRLLDRPVFYLWVLSAICSSCFSFWWDIHMDWGFLKRNGKEHRFLRDSLIYASIWYYYVAVVEDLLMRFAWTISILLNELGLIQSEITTTLMAVAEMIRRFTWNFFRLENEQLNNCGEFRAIRDIPVTEEDSTDFDLVSIKKKSIPRIHSIWKVDQDESLREKEARPGVTAELYPVSMPDPCYHPEEEDDDNPNESFLINLDPN